MEVAVNQCKIIILSVVFSVFMVSTVMADQPGNRGNKAKGKPKDNSGINVEFSIGISWGEARALATEMNLTGAKPIPPGIRKNLARGKAMPPGIAMTRMPETLLSKLPRHDGYEWQWRGSDLVLVAIGTLIVVEILEGIFD